MPIVSRAAICPLGVREGGRGRATEVSVNRRVFSADSARSVARTRAGVGCWGGVGLVPRIWNPSHFVGV